MNMMTKPRPLFLLTCILLLGTSIKPKAARELDTLWMGQRLDHDLCWITWESSYLPVLDGIPNAQAWNDSISSFEALVKHWTLTRQPHYAGDTTFCAGFIDGDDELNFPRGEGLVGTFRFQELTWSDSVISLLLTCNIHFNGGNLDWNECLAINIDARSGLGVKAPVHFDDVREATLDADIRNCVYTEACSPTFQSYSHSEEYPDHLNLAVQECRIGVRDGMWVECFDFNPFSWCARMVQTVCVVELTDFHLDSASLEASPENPNTSELLRPELLRCTENPSERLFNFLFIVPLVVLLAAGLWRFKGS